MKPMLDPKRDLKGATPERLAKALLRTTEVRKLVPGDKLPVEEVATHKPRSRRPHLLKST